MFHKSSRIVILLFSLWLHQQEIKAQNSGSKNLNYPLDIPLSMAGSFGEIRANSFHTGIDFKTQGRVGANVHAVDDGYVVRIKVEPSGFGQAVYINHPNGYTSVYGHVESFRDDIDQYCKNEQYKRKQFGVDITLTPNEIIVKKGDIIALSGNRGGSSGPHLHFEYRETKTEFPVSVFRFTNISITDTLSPVIDNVWIYPLHKDSRVNKRNEPVRYDVINTKGKSRIRAGKPIMVRGDIGIGIQAFDLNNSSVNKTGVYSIELWVNEELVFEQLMDKLSFADVRYVNSLIDYENFMRRGIRINRLFVQPNNQLKVYPHLVNRGVISCNDSLPKHIRIVVKDEYLNKRECSFMIRSDRQGLGSISPSPKPGKLARTMNYKVENTFVTDNLKLFIPKDALYDDLLFEYATSPKLPGYFSKVLEVHNVYTPLHKTATLSVKPSGLPDSLLGKAVLMSIDSEGRVKWCGGGYKDGYVVGGIRSFGRYIVGIDTTPPMIKPLFTRVRENDFSAWGQIAFMIRDDQSGINVYKAFVDDQWVLLEYDPKQDLAFYKFDPKRMQFGRQHKLDLLVMDERGNKSEYHTQFFK
jgi:murein DD-endopeptidase MepM/ murein hydrolase activator NlpD